ncbi:MAG: transposase [Anaerolineae bacterium]|nr:transposase [Anaerolineae bacterium]
MKGLTDYLTEQSWEDTIIATFVFVDDHLPEAQRRIGFQRRRGPAPEHDDSVIITIALVAEYWFGGDEEKTLAFLRQYHADLWSSGIPDAGRFNIRRRALTLVMEEIRRQLRDRWRAEHSAADHTSAEASDLEARIRLVDSAPVILASRPRGHASPISEPEDRHEWFGVCTSQQFKFFGGRFHATVDSDQMLDEWLLAPGSYSDLKVLPALCDGYHDLIYIGDKGYVDTKTEDLLWERGRHLLLPLRRDNQHHQWPAGIQRILGRLRHRIESAFSVLTTAFTLRFPHSRSLTGCLARLATKALAYTLSFFLAQRVAA